MWKVRQISYNLWLRLKIVAATIALVEGVSKKDKLIAKLLSKSKNFTWDDTTTLMGACGYKLVNASGGGSGRMFVHTGTGQKVRLHEPHPQNTLLPYMVRQLTEALIEAGEIKV